jgi:outer membrane receptor protein involved in Fe transport
MIKRIGGILTVLLVSFCGLSAHAQSATISGNVKNSGTKEVVSAVSVTIKGTNSGTFTDDKGNFSITAKSLPVTLLITSIGFEIQEVTVANTTPIEINLKPSNALGQEVVVSATRVATRILESPVTIERVGAAAIRDLAAPSYYDAIGNLKGVDQVSSSFTFKTYSTRGFNGSGNLRMNQFIDGMDNQAPGLNFSVGSIVGLTELDVDNMELLPGASSALYGSGGMNGTLLINSKNPFKYQGFSFQVKQGIMHTDSRQRSQSPYYDWTFRWAKAFNNKFAFKVAGQLIQAQDWQANDLRNYSRDLNKDIPGDRSATDYDGVNVYGDDFTANMRSIAQSVVDAGTAGFRAQFFAATGTQPTQAQINAFLSSNSQTQPFFLGLQNNIIPNAAVSRTGYNEAALLDYNTNNYKFTGGLFYKLSSTVEASLNAYWGAGTTVYTGSDRYSLRNVKIAQYKAEVKGKGWHVRLYTTQENAGDAYNATALATNINNTWKDNSAWYPQYVGNYVGAWQNTFNAVFTPAFNQAFSQAIAGGQTTAQATATAQAAATSAATTAANNSAPALHNFARGQADVGRLLPGTAAFEAAKNKSVNTPISRGGSRFNDKTNLYAGDAQYGFGDKIPFVDVLIGANFKQFALNSEGTIFADTAGRIIINEFGGFVQLQKSLFNDRLKLTAAGRYDKNDNFEGRFTPRVTALVKVAKENNIRLSYQSGFRLPSTQNQYINLDVVRARLIGGLPTFRDFFKFNTNPVYTQANVAQYGAAFQTAFAAAVAAGQTQAQAQATAAAQSAGVLKPYEFKDFKAEDVQSYEVGYKGLLFKRLLIDAFVYSSTYNNFIATEILLQSKVPASSPVRETGLLSGNTRQVYSTVVTSPTKIKAFGWGFGAELLLPRNFMFTGNVSGNELRDVPVGLVTFFNTPKTQFNVGLANNKILKRYGFNISYRWQDEFLYEGTFAAGTVPSFGSLDAQISMRLPKTKSIVKIGGTNIQNKYFQNAFGNPSIGGMYYVSFGYNVY